MRLLILVIFLIDFCYLSAQEFTLPEDTEVWNPVPKIVDTFDNLAPSDAIILFDKDSLNNWQKINGNPADWEVNSNIFTIKPGTGDILTKQKFSNVQFHIEWRAPRLSGESGQNRGNSGIFFQERYELQILDSYNNKTYTNGQAGSIYKQFVPLVNASREPYVWQNYDVIFIAPTFNDDGSINTRANMTVFHNGILVQYKVILEGATTYIGKPKYDFHNNGSILLQDHGSKISFRNIWVREIEVP